MKCECELCRMRSGKKHTIKVIVIDGRVDDVQDLPPGVRVAVHDYNVDEDDADDVDDDGNHFTVTWWGNGLTIPF